MNEKLYSLPLEQSVLSILMITYGVDEHLENLTEDDFHATRHIAIFKLIKKRHSEGKGYDVEIICDMARKNADMGFDVEYIIDLNVNSIGSAHRLSDYIEKMKEYTRRRALFNAGERIKTIASDITQYDVIEAVAQSESVLSQLEDNKDSGTVHEAFDLSVELLGDLVERIEARKNGNEKINGVKTGFTQLDKQIGVISNGDLVYIGARPSMGKTAFIQSVMLEVSFMQQLPILFQSAEMKAQKIMHRLISSLGEINLRHIRDADMKDDEWGKYNEASLRLQKCKFMIDDKSMPTVTDIRRNCRKLRAKYGKVGAVFIDYLTLLKGSIKSDRNDLVVGDISNRLKALAKEFDCPVICLAQLNRGVESRSDKRPLLSDLRESGSIEQDADVILFLYRDEYYNKDTKEPGIAEVIAAKVRDGEVGTVRLAFEGRYSRFCDLDYQEQDF